MPTEVSLYQAGGRLHGERLPVPFDGTNDTLVAGANTAVALTLAADADVGLILDSIVYGYSAAPTGGSLQVQDGTTVVFGPIPITAAGLGQVNFNPPKIGTSNTALVITLAAGGGSVTGALFANCRKLA